MAERKEGRKKENTINQYNVIKRVEEKRTRKRKRIEDREDREERKQEEDERTGNERAGRRELAEGASWILPISLSTSRLSREQQLYILQNISWFLYNEPPNAN
jgi:hypothetical protein